MQMRGRRLGAASVCLATAGAAVLVPAASTAAARTDALVAPAALAKPNIIVISADDLGWSQPSLNGGAIATPNIDSIAATGVRFTDGYVSAPVCSPSRAALLTGRHGARFGADSNQLSRSRPERLPATTMASMLKGRGYTTMAVGKWDLAGFDVPPGEPNAPMPHRAGFDGFYGILKGLSAYCAGTGMLHRYTGSGYAEVPRTQYMTHQLTGAAADFVTAHKSDADPFFLYLSYNAPHTPIQTPESCQGQTVPEEQRFRRMVEIMDHGVGAVLNALGDDAEARNTIVVFTSDNGPQLAYFSPDLRGKKYSLFEGGIRVPFAMKWPAALGAGPRTYSEMVSTLDLLPTVAAASGAPVTGYDGKDLVPYVTGQQTGVPHQRLHWRYVDDQQNAQQGAVELAIRSGDYKYVRETGPSGASTEYLFDLAADRDESTNLAGQLPEVKNRLIREHQDWNEQNRQNDGFENPRPAGQPRAGQVDGYLGYDGSWSAPGTDGDDAYRGVADGAAGRVMLPGTYYADVDAAVDVRLRDNGHAGLVVRGRSAPAAPFGLTGYVVRLASPADGPDRIIVSKVLNGAATEVKQHARPVNPDVDYRLGVRMAGATMTVTVNGTQQFQWTDPDPIAGGSVGLRVVGATALFDHLTAARAG